MKRGGIKGKKWKMVKKIEFKLEKKQSEKGRKRNMNYGRRGKKKKKE